MGELPCTVKVYNTRNATKLNCSRFQREEDEDKGEIIENLQNRAIENKE